MYRVILIEDHPVVSAAIRGLLEAQGQFEVVAIRESGTAGLAAVRELKPELVILDLSIPQLGGIEIISRLRAASNAVPILVLSGENEVVSGMRVFRAGANGFVHKSGDLGEVAMAALLVAKGRTFFTQEILYAADNASPASAPLEALSKREFEVFHCLVKGQSNKEIAEHMLLSSKTVSAYKIKIMDKLGVSNIRDLIEVARAARLLEP